MTAHPLCKFKKDDVVRIRRRFANGESGDALGREFDASGQSIRNIAYGRTYTDCGGPISQPRGNKGENNGFAKLTAKDVALARALHRDGQSIVAIAQSLNCERTTVSKVCNHETWIHICDLPRPKALIDAGADSVIADLQARFPGQARITPAAFIEALEATEVWFTRQTQAGALKTIIYMGVTMIRMTDAIEFLRAESVEDL